MGELFVTMCVLAKGGAIHRNVSSSGAVDIVMQLGQHFFPIDVKVCSYCQGGRNKTKSWKAGGMNKVPDYVYPVLVEPVGGTDFQQWKIRWAMKSGQTRNTNNIQWRCPPGLQNLWDKDFQPITDHTT